LGIRAQYISDMHRSINLSKDLKAYREIKKTIQHFKPDIVHTHASKAGTLGRMAAFACKVPVVVHTFHGHVFHSYFSKSKTKFFIALEQYLARKSNAIITLSPVQQNEIVHQFKICEAEKAIIIPLGFELQRFSENMDEKRDAFRKKFGIAEHELAIGIIGRLTAIKNHPMFLRSMAQLKSSFGKKVKGVIVGNGEDYHNLLHLAQSLGLDCGTAENNFTGDIVFTSWIKNIDEAIAGLDIVAMTSFNEGTPVSLIEAQAGQKPIVSTRVGGIEDIVIENESAFLCESENVEMFCEHLSAFINSPERRKAMGQAGHQMVMQKFSRQRLVSDMQELYRRLLQSKQ